MSTTELAAAGGFDGARVTDVALRFSPDVTEERATQIVALIGKIDRSAKWWLATWLTAYTERFGLDDGTKALQIAAAMTGYSEVTLANYRDVARMLPENVRDGSLDFSSHVELARLIRAGLGVPVVEEVRDRLITMRDQWSATQGSPFPNHKMARKIVGDVIRERGVTDRMFHFPTREEQIADQSEEITQLRAQLDEAHLNAGSHVECPECGLIQPVEAARVVA